MSFWISCDKRLKGRVSWSHDGIWEGLGFVLICSWSLLVLGILGKCCCLFGLDFSEHLFEQILVLVLVRGITFIVAGAKLWIQTCLKI